MRAQRCVCSHTTPVPKRMHPARSEASHHEPIAVAGKRHVQSFRSPLSQQLHCNWYRHSLCLLPVSIADVGHAQLHGQHVVVPALQPGEQAGNHSVASIGCPQRQGSRRGRVSVRVCGGVRGCQCGCGRACTTAHGTAGCVRACGCHLRGPAGVRRQPSARPACSETAWRSSSSQCGSECRRLPPAPASHSALW